MGFPMLTKWYLYIESGPWCLWHTSQLWLQLTINDWKIYNVHVILGIIIAGYIFPRTAANRLSMSMRCCWVVYLTNTKPTARACHTIYRKEARPTWWRHQMETFSALLAFCARNLPVTGEFPAQRPVTWSFDVFFDLRMNKRLSKQSWGWWFETPSRPLWRHSNANGYNISNLDKTLINSVMFYLQ